MNPVACGIEISAKTLGTCVLLESGTLVHREFPNTPGGHRTLIGFLHHHRAPVRVCLEATGHYGLDLAFALHAASRIELMVANPRAVRRFAHALMRRAKTDRLDAEVLSLFAARMPFKPWQAPPPEALALRALTRRINTLTRQRTAEKNRLHAARQTRSTPPALDQSLLRAIRQLDQEIDRLARDTQQLIHHHPWLAQRHRLLLSITGIGPKSALQILGELAVLSPDLDPRQWVAHAGLDPRPRESGSSLHKPRRISKTGNPYLRQALYMPALVARRFDPQVQVFADSLTARGKRPLEAIVAIMRKLLHAIHAVWKHQQPYDSRRLFQPHSAMTHHAA